MYVFLLNISVSKDPIGSRFGSVVHLQNSSYINAMLDIFAVSESITFPACFDGKIKVQVFCFLYLY